jgi:RHS repeat-associated protein
VVDVRTDEDRQAVTGQAQGNAFGGELPGEFLYFFHPDHLGSTSYVTDDKGALYEHLQYFPFGETWVQEGQPSQRIPYLFTSKELDEETGLYYFGARYYDPRMSLWVSADPALGEYLPSVWDMLSAQEDGRRYQPDESLPGIGGIYRTLNLGVFVHAHQNPVRVKDPDGRMARPEDLTGSRQERLLHSAGGGGPSGLHKTFGRQIVQAVKALGQRIKSLFRGRSAESNSGNVSGKSSTLSPGPHAKESVPARGPERDFTRAERDAVNDIGQQHGCHTCGTKNPGTKSGDFIPDHQPPNVVNPPGNPQELYPQCLTCSRRQGGELRSRK